MQVTGDLNSDLNKFQIARKAKTFDKIRDLPEMEARQNLGMIFTKAANLVGFKNEIGDINKADIRNMIFKEYRNLSLQEIDYAFEHDRYSGDPIDHYQMFNSVYVTKVLKKYIKWRNAYRKENQLDKKALPIPDIKISEAEKQQNHENFIRMIFERLEVRETVHDAWLLYDLVDAPKKDDVDYKKNLYNAQKAKYYEDEKNVNPFKKITRGEGEKYIKNRCKAIIVSKYLKDYINDYEIFRSKIISKKSKN